MPEILITLIVICCLSLFALGSGNIADLEHLAFMNAYLIRQSEAIMNKEAYVYSDGITFNQMGHVNQGKTIHFGRHEVIIHLGNGYATWK